MTHDNYTNNSSDVRSKVPMTHDELLAKLDDIEQKTNHTPLVLGVQTALLTQNKALRAVAELHKPDTNHYGYEECMHCEYPVEYPCPTIQSITEELK